MTYFTVPTFGTAIALMTIRRIKIAKFMTQKAALLALNDFLITLASC